MAADLNAVVTWPETWRRQRRGPAPGAPSEQTDLAELWRGAAHLDAVGVSAWFGNHLVLDDVSLSMPAATVTTELLSPVREKKGGRR